MFFLYNVVISLLFFLVGPFVFLFILIKGIEDQHFKERFGLLPGRLAGRKERGLRIWLHAVSIGEVKLAKVIAEAIQERRKDVSIVVSTTTKSGMQTAHSLMPSDVAIIHNPIDLVWCVRLALRRVAPDLFINLETEIWPNFLWACRELGIPAFLVNGRISVRSFNTYKRVRAFMQEVISVYSLLSMISSDNACRVISIGADPRKVVVGGNAKYDALPKEATAELSHKIASLYRIDGTRPVFVAGSTRSGEEGIIIEAYRELRIRYPNLILIIAPRHIERCSTIASMLRKYHLDYCMRHSLQNDARTALPADIVIVDTFGELFGIYSIGTVLFCGGSLVPLGGQNPLEAAIWAKPVLYGPSMGDFLEAKDLLESVGAGFVVRDSHELVKTAAWLLDNSEEYERLGRRAREEITRHMGSATRQVEQVFKVFHETQ